MCQTWTLQVRVLRAHMGSGGTAEQTRYGVATYRTVEMPHGKHAVMCQNWDGSGPMLAASAGPEPAQFWHVYKECKDHSLGNPIIQLKWSWDRISFIIGIPIPKDQYNGSPVQIFLGPK